MDSRMQAILNFVEEGSRVADIGADHGYLSIELIKNGRAVKVIATEKNLGPFETLRKNISNIAGIEARIGDGLKVLKANEVDTICVAGMGGALITNILDDAPVIVQSARQLILQPMNATKKVRDWLTKNNWSIVDEDLAESAEIIYEIICAQRKSSERIFKRESSPLLNKFLTQRLEKLQRTLFEMSKSYSALSSEKFSTMQKEVKALRESIDAGNGLK